MTILKEPAVAVEQQRRLVTQIPGLRSCELMTRKAAAVAAGGATSMPAFADRASGGVVDVDGNQLIDLGFGAAVTTGGDSAHRVVEAVRGQVTASPHTCFMVAPHSLRTPGPPSVSSARAVAMRNPVLVSVRP